MPFTFDFPTKQDGEGSNNQAPNTKVPSATPAFSFGSPSNSGATVAMEQPPKVSKPIAGTSGTSSSFSFGASTTSFSFGALTTPAFGGTSSLTTLGTTKVPVKEGTATAKPSQIAGASSTQFGGPAAFGATTQLSKPITKPAPSTAAAPAAPVHSDPPATAKPAAEFSFGAAPSGPVVGATAQSSEPITQPAPSTVAAPVHSDPAATAKPTAGFFFGAAPSTAAPAAPARSDPTANAKPASGCSFVSQPAPSTVAAPTTAAVVGKLVVDDNGSSTDHPLTPPTQWTISKFADTLIRLQENDPELTKLDLRGCQIGDSGAKVIANALATNSALLDLNLSCSGLGNDGISCLVRALRTNSTLRALNLSQNEIDTLRAEHLAGALRTNTALTKLDLSCSNIGDSGAELMAQVLRIEPTLRDVNLTGNKISDMGARYLAQALSTNTTLQNLNLSGNRSGDHGAKRLSKALHTNTALRELHLRGNDIGASGAQHLANMLDANTSLRVLDLSDNEITDSGAMCLALALRMNTTLQELPLDKCTTKHLDFINQLLAWNRSRLNRSRRTSMNLPYVADPNNDNIASVYGNLAQLLRCGDHNGKDGTLFSRVSNAAFREQTVWLLLQCALPLENNSVHTDIKPEDMQIRVGKSTGRIIEVKLRDPDLEKPEVVSDRAAVRSFGVLMGCVLLRNRDANRDSLTSSAVPLRELVQRALDNGNAESDTITEQLVELCLQCLATDPVQRRPTGVEVVTKLRDILRAQQQAMSVESTVEQ